MKRLSKAAVLTVAAGVAVMGSAGGALASDGNDFDRGGASAEGAAIGSPGVLSGNVLQAPINIPVNLCGNSINTVAPSLLNFTTGNACINA